MAGCSKPAPRVDGPAQQGIAANVASTATGSSAACGRDSLHPSAAPPAEGIWTSSGSADGEHVAAMIGPAEVRAGSTFITRAIETVEPASSALVVRTRLDNASMRLELVPRYLGERVASSARTRDAGPRESAAVYALTPFVSVISYEACAGPPAVRYLRRTVDGAIARDVMLRRTGTLE